MQEICVKMTLDGEKKSAKIATPQLEKSALHFETTEEQATLR
jgi:hypothetical protein